MNPNKLKIVFCITNDPVTDRRMNRICSAVAEFGHEVELIGVDRSRKIDQLPTDFKITKIKPLFKKSFLFYAEYNLRLFFILLFRKMDIVSSADIDTVLACKTVSTLRNKKIVFDAHEYFSEVPELKGKKIKKGIWKSIESCCLPAINSNYTVSESLADIYNTISGKIYKVIRNVPSMAEFEDFKNKSYENNEIKLLSYVGALNEGRGIEQMIYALSKLPNRFKLQIIGGGPLEEKIDEIIKQLHIEDRIYLKGWVSPQDIPGLLKGSFLGFNILMDDSINYQVSLANKIFDYIHLGIPCISTDFKEYQKINQKFDCLYLINNNEADSISNFIKNIEEDKEEYYRKKVNCADAAEILNWESEKIKLKEIYFL
ncbi:MAG: glycosyltransferase [Saprospiraceae bacterium]